MNFIHIVVELLICDMLIFLATRLEHNLVEIEPCFIPKQEYPNIKVVEEAN
jgi:hypothetical protein